MARCNGCDHVLQQSPRVGAAPMRLHIAFARQVAMYLAHVAWGLTLTDVGHLFSRDRTTVAHACGLIEDSRDDPMLDRSLELLEGVLRAFSPGSIGSSVGFFLGA